MWKYCIIIISQKLFIPSFSFHRHKLIIGSYNKDLKIKKLAMEEAHHSIFLFHHTIMGIYTHIHVVSLIPLQPSCLHHIHIILPVSTLEYSSHSFCRSVGL